MLVTNKMLFWVPVPSGATLPYLAGAFIPTKSACLPNKTARLHLWSTSIPDKYNANKAILLGNNYSVGFLCSTKRKGEWTCTRYGLQALDVTSHSEYDASGKQQFYSVWVPAHEGLVLAPWKSCSTGSLCVLW